MQAEINIIKQNGGNIKKEIKSWEHKYIKYKSKYLKLKMIK